jgi:hypothetical protein
MGRGERDAVLQPRGEHLSETGRRFDGIDGSRLEGTIPFSRIENEAEWVSAWEEIKTA